MQHRRGHPKSNVAERTLNLLSTAFNCISVILICMYYMIFVIKLVDWKLSKYLNTIILFITLRN